MVALLQITFRGLTLPYKESASGISIWQELPFCIFTAKFSKIPTTKGYRVFGLVNSMTTWQSYVIALENTRSNANNRHCSSA